MTDDDTKPEPMVANWLEVRQFAIGLTITAERMLESLGYPVETSVIRRQERRESGGLTKSKR